MKRVGTISVVAENATSPILPSTLISKPSMMADNQRAHKKQEPASSPRD